MKKHAVAIPIYRFPLMPEEEVSLALVRRVLSEHKQYIVCPQSLVIPGEFLNGEQVLRFPDACFSYPDGYNRMLMSKFFYKAFEQFQHILIYQLDCLVFRDELSMWCEKGYDYIGSPWYENYIYSYQERSKWWIGNGGFSLRKVSTALDVLSKKIKTADRYQFPLSSKAQANRHKRIFWCTYRFVKSLCGLWTVEDELNSYGESEDRFWSLDAGKFLKEYKVAPVKEGMLFGFEQYPEKCFQENGGVIPFGCHAWAKHNRGFIESMLKNAGISLQ